MKTVLLTVCLLFASAAFAQSYPSMSPLEFGDHAYHAAPHAWAAPTSILGGNNVTVASGEVPLADIPMPQIHETPLGDVARQVRQEKLFAKKAQVIWENPVYGDKPVKVAQW